MQGVAVPLLKPGDKAGRYELLLQIAQGGMGAVWVARLKLDNGFEKLFAVKTLLTHLADQAVFRQMFLDEARIAASIEHPNVGQILDMGEQEDLLYLVMEWVEGESINALARVAALDNKKLPYGVMLRMLSDACAGLHAVHEHKDRDGRPLDIVHRDVSPHNMLVSSRGVTKMIDFGVAKARDRLTGATQNGAVKGKLRYMAPEQACGGTVDRRSDVWGVGAVLYTLVAGRYPYGGETDVDVLRAMMSGRPPAPLPPSVPPPIERVIKRALSVTPSERHQTAAELGDDLDNAARELGMFTSTHGVATYLEETAGPRLAKLRAAIHTAIEAQESRGKQSSSQPALETTMSSTLVDLHQPTATGSQTGTLMGTTQQWPLALPMMRWSMQKSLAAAGSVALVGLIVLLISRATAERTSIPSASAAAPTAEGIPPAQASAPEEPGIDLDSPTPAVTNAVPPPAPPARVPDPPPRVVQTPPPRVEPKAEPARHVAAEPAHAEAKAPPREPPPRVSSPPPVSPPTTSRPQNVFSSPGTTSSAAPKKRPLETAIDTRR